jgi:SHS2 domain-containing protein
MENPLSAGAPAGFETVEHTADIGLRVWGRSLEEMFEQAAAGMISLLVTREGTRSTERRELVIEAADREEALVSFLQELLYLYEVERFIPAAVRVVSAGPSGARCRLEGEAFDPNRHRPRTDIKAATYHDLNVSRTLSRTGGVRWESVIIFDI